MYNTRSEMEDRVVKLIQELRPNPCLYIGELSVSKLASYVLGFEDGLRNMGLSRSEYSLFRDFNDFECSKYNIEDVRGWINTLLEICGEDEREALAAFFEDWDVFLSERYARLTS